MVCSPFNVQMCSLTLLGISWWLDDFVTRKPFHVYGAERVHVACIMEVWGLKTTCKVGKAKPYIHLYEKGGGGGGGKDSHLNPELGILRRAVRCVLALACEGGVVVLLSRHHFQRRFYREQRPALVLLQLRGYSFVQHVTQAIDPRDLENSKHIKKLYF